MHLTINTANTASNTVAALAVAIATAAVPVSAQWVHYRDSAVPRTRDGKPNLSAPTPRTADGKPDLSGVWMHELTPASEIRRLFGPTIDDRIKVDVPGMEIGTQHKYAFNILLDYDEGVMLRPEARERMRLRAQTREPVPVCLHRPGGHFVRADLLSEAIKIVQAPRITMVLYEAGDTHRQIHTDGRALPEEFDLPSFLGYSVGRWEGNTFVVETAGFNDKTVLDGQGHLHTEQLRVIERYTRRDYGHLDIETTFDDPEMYTKPFTIKVPHDLLPDTDIFESFCENEKDSAHLAQR
jgi:hypothetical protein